MKLIPFCYSTINEIGRRKGEIRIVCRSKISDIIIIINCDSNSLTASKIKSSASILQHNCIVQ